MNDSKGEIDEYIVDNELIIKLRGIINKLKIQNREEGDSPILYFYGPYGSGKQDAARWMCHELDIPMLAVDLNTAYNTGKNFSEILTLINRESILLNASLYFHNADRIFEDEAIMYDAKDCFIKNIKESNALIFFATKNELHFKEEFRGRELFKFGFSIPGFEERKRFWIRYMNGKYSFSDEVEIDSLAGKFQLTGGEIKDAIHTAYCRALARGNSNSKITDEDLYEGCRGQSNRKLKELAQQIKPKHTWNDIILPYDEVDQLREICNHIKYKHIVFEDWEFGKKHSLGKGLNALFHGPSGTGKTMAAEIVASDLNLDLYKIDLSTIVSKYIGETEKNLGKIFKEAKTSNSILFFDEADALFGKRSDVKDAHDRYANIEVGYLLQKMDEYDGIVILATNMLDNMDSAFVRRMHFIVEFPFPDKDERFQIWKNVFTDKTPLDSRLDFDYLARQFNITGGNIKNISTAAALYAAGDGRIVTMRHVVHATKRELRKIGRACTGDDFGDYAELLQ